MQKLMSHPLDSGHQVQKENIYTRFHQNPIRHCKVMDQIWFDNWPWLRPWPLRDRAESWVLHFRSMRRMPVPSFIKIPSGIAKLWTGHNLKFDVDCDLDLWPDRAECWVLHFRCMRRIPVPSFIKIPPGIAKLWTGHDLIFDLDCDLDLWLTGPKVGFCTLGPWGEYLYQVSSKSHQAMQSYGPDTIWHLALTVTLTLDRQG